jgi:TolB-like protein/Tfp pilus assembly protein PilF
VRSSRAAMSRRGIRERFRDWLRRWRDVRAKHLVFVFLHARRLIASNEDRQLPFRAEAAQRLQSRGRLRRGVVAADPGGVDFVADFRRSWLPSSAELRGRLRSRWKRSSLSRTDFARTKMNSDRFFAELRRRNVYKVAVAYIVAGWALAQGIAQVLPVFDTPNWLIRLLVVLIILGLPIALAMAWAFESTPEGIKRTEEADVMPAEAAHAKRTWIYVAIVGTLLSIGLFFVGRYTAVTKQNPGSSTKSIAVLPFENLSDDKQNTYFADGVQDQILTNLAKVSDLKVTSHTSARQYKSGIQRNLREIGQQLGVAYIVEGSVQRAGDRLRINAQLIDAHTDTHIWAETYDRTAADLFAIQSELAESIVAQLKATLSPKQKAEIEERPTQDLVAFDLYLQAKQIVDSYLIAEDVRAALLKALQSLDEAIKRDEKFVAAYCYAARANDLLYFFDLDPTRDRILLAETAVNAALRLRPDSAEAHFAVADFLFRCRRDYDRALQELAIARPGLPNSTPFFILSGYINRRRNHWPEAERDFSTAVTLDPRNPNAYNLLADTYVLQRNFSDAVKTYERVLAAGERTPIVLFRQASATFNGTADSKPLREVLAKSPDMDVAGGQTPVRVLFALIDGNYTEADRVLAASPRQDFQDIDFSFYFPKAWFEGLIARTKGDSGGALGAYSAARTILEQRLVVKPEHARTIAVLAQVDAALGRKELATREAEHAVELMPISRDIYDGALVLEGLAQVYTWTNERDRAIELLQKLVKMPGYINYARLKLHPMWNPLRGDPRFEAIVASLAPK